MTLSTRLAAREAPDAIALVDGEGALTFAELDRRVSSRAAALATRAGVPVPFEATATRDAVVELLAILERGASAVPLHPRWSERERSDVLRDAEGFEDPSIAALVRTSGTSGRPKLAALSERALRAAAEASARRLGWRDGDRWLLSLPFAHVGGLSVIVRCLLARRTLVLATEALDALTTAGCTLASLVPTQLARLVQRGLHAPAGLRAVLVGGAACAPAIVRGARSLGWPVRLTYGLTETCAQFATQREGDPDDSVGPALDGYEARIAGGLLELRTPSLLDGFVQQGRLLRAVDADGWYRTGDEARLEGGLLRVLGRADDVIITGGEKVQPAEVEAVLAEALGAETCVVGVPDPEWGCVVGAVVSQRDLDDVVRALAAVSARLAKHALPRLAVIVDALPKTPGGKVDRRAIAAWPRDRWHSVRPPR